MSEPVRWQTVHGTDPRDPKPLLASAAVLCAGLFLLWTDPGALAWLGTGFFALCTLVLGAGTLGWLPSPQTGEEILLDASRLTRTLGSTVEAVRLDEVVYLELVTTADGPMVDDLYLAVIQEDGTGCLVPQSAWDTLELLDRVARLDGVIWEALTLASSSMVDYRFPLWRGERGDAAGLGQPISSTTLPRIRPVSP